MPGFPHFANWHAARSALIGCRAHMEVRIVNETVLNLGERIVLAARLAAIEHVRQAMDQEDQLAHAVESVHSEELLAELQQRWGHLFDRPTSPTRKGAA